MITVVELVETTEELNPVVSTGSTTGLQETFYEL